MARFNPIRFNGIRQAGHEGGAIRSPASLVGILAVSVFTIEFCLEAAFPDLPPKDFWADALLNGAILTLLLSPVLYLFLFRPLCNNISALQQARKQLEDQREHLEQAVRLRTNELIKANEALEASFAQIDDLYQNAPFGYHSIDKDGVVVKMNDTELSWLGYTADEIIGKKRIRDMLTSNSVANFGAQFAHLREFGWLKDTEAEFIRKDGSVFPALVNVSAVRDEHGQFVMSRASVYDITIRKKAQQEREQYFKFFNASSDLMAISGKDGAIKKVNQAFLSTLGYSEAELLARPYFDLIHPDDLAQTMHEVAALPLRGYAIDFENRNLCKDGSVRWLSWSAIMDEDGHIYATARDITDQKHYRESLFNSNQLLERVFNTTHFCAVYLDRDFNFIRVNQAYADACGCETGYFPGKNHFRLYPHEENEAIFRNVVRTGEVITVAAKAFAFPDHPEWGVTYWDWILHPLKSPEGKVEALLFVLLDVTERKRAEVALTRFAEELEVQVAERTAELRAKEQQLQETLLLNQNILMASEIGIAAYRPDGQCILVNPSFAKMVGGTEEQLLSQNFYRLRSWRESGLFGDAERVLATGVPAEKEVQLTSTFGRELWLNCHASQFTSRGEAHLLLMFHDIREERLTARALRESEQRFKILAAATFEGVAISAEGKLVDVNDQLARMLGYERHELIGQQVLNLIAPEDRERVEAVMQAETESHAEHEILCKDGSRLVIDAHGQTMEKDGVSMRLTAIRDITARVRAAAELKAAKGEAERANNAKSRFLAAASHDLRQPLTALKLYASVLKLNLSVEDQATLGKMEECVGSLSDLLSKLLDFSKLEAGVVTPQVCDFSLDDMLNKVLAAYGPKADAKDLNLRVGRFGLNLRTDPVLFQRILGNLVHNAIRYTARGGVLVACRRHQAKQWIEVWDTGIGIPEHKAHEIFEEFRQIAGSDSTRGSGLGLAIVARTATLLGLAVRAHSCPGRGSMFAIELPLGSSRCVTANPKGAMPRQGLHVAVVDDDPSVLDALVRAMENAGHKVSGAASGKDLLSRPDMSPPDIVICDYRLAGGETAFDLIASARAAFRKDLPAVIITGDTDPDVMRSMAERGIAIQYKPVEIGDLLARINETVATTSPYNVRR